MQYLCCGRRQSTNLATIPETKLAWSVAACKLARIEVHAPRTTETERCATGRVIPALACTSLPAQTAYSELGPSEMDKACSYGPEGTHAHSAGEQ